MELQAAEFVRVLAPGVFDQGRASQRAGRVRDAQIRERAGIIVVTGRVREETGQDHTVYVEVAPAGARDDARVDGDCNCATGYNCEHVVAVLLDAGVIVQEPGGGPAPATADEQGDRIGAAAGRDGSLHRWIDQVARARSLTPTSNEPGARDRLLYLLERPTHWAGSVVVPVALVTCRPLKGGAYGKLTPFNVQRAWQVHPASVLGADDVEILRLAGPIEDGRASHAVHLQGELGARLLAAMLATGRCHWHAPSARALAAGEPLPARIEWHEDEAGRQRLMFRSDPPSALVLPLCPPWSLDLEQGRCAPLVTGLEPALAMLAALAPAISPEQAAALPPELERLAYEIGLPRPQSRPVRDVHEPARPRLRLLPSGLEPVDPNTTHWWKAGVPIPCRAVLTFEYAGHEVEPQAIAGEPQVLRVGDSLLRLHRDTPAEARAIETVLGHGLHKRHATAWRALQDEVSSPAGLELVMPSGEERARSAWLGFLRHAVPALRAEGWLVEIAEDFDHRLITPQAWAASVAEVDGGGWFDLELGLVVEGDTVSLLPILHELLHGPDGRNVQDLLARKDHEDLILPFEGAWLCLPVSRVRAILDTLVELLDPRLEIEEGLLRLPALRAAEVEDFDRRAGGLDWREGAGQRLAALAGRIHAFVGARPRPAPEGFGTALRPYQERGLGWLQALRELGLGGILADDMGLGKTVQALGHLVVEKQAGRMHGPALVVAPTSVLANWRHEAERFAPGLCVLVLHGSARHEYFPAIAAHDLVITTYALALRDREQLADHLFHCLILDEAQAVKNPKSKTRKALASLRARHRLCLTGTPLENHLGELWSLVDLVEPGLLGDSRQFARLFRQPIEQRGNADRRRLLGRRIAPLLLRRGKEEIDDELPDKVEITQLVDLHAQQRDLYETVRVAMQRKVRDALAEHGFERSRIIVLDALLKLRQICCDPRLVKLDAARRVHQSAKLELLLDLLVEMLDEGRRVLLFSQFTSMLELIKARLDAAGIAYAELRGSTKDRETPVARFQGGDVPLFLVSLKAGGTGLNLTAADTVIHYDPWWNPAVEAQATDRAYRIGQDKKVFVYKLIGAGTVEQRMLGLQERKQRLTDAVLGDAGVAGGGDLRAEDLDFLLEPID